MNRVGATLNPYLSNGGLETDVKGSGADQYAKWLTRANYSISDKSSKQNCLADKP